MSTIFKSLAILALAHSVYGACSVNGIDGQYSKHLVANFANAKKGQAASSVLDKAGFSISEWSVENLGASFQKDMVTMIDGAVQLKVKANQGKILPSAQIVTKESMKYGSFRTVMKSSSRKGVCEGIFTYANDNNEIDWEILTQTTMNKGVRSPFIPAGVWMTNQPAYAGAPKTSKAIQQGFDPKDAFHEYRFDWDPKKTVFYIDGVKKGEFTQNVPQVLSQFMVNVWSNGDPGWSAGPPTGDSNTFVKSIEIFHGYAAGKSAEVCRSSIAARRMVKARSVQEDEE